MDFLKNRKKSTIFSKIFIPVMLIVCIQIFLFTVLLQGNLLSFMKEDAVDSLQGKVSNRAQSIQNEMLGKWSNISAGVDSVKSKIKSTLKKNEAAVSDIQSNAALNQMIISSIMPEMIHMMRSCGATETFLVLNGSSVQADPQAKAGVYLRNTNPNTFSESNEDLLFERGIPSISKEWKIPLDSFWSASFDVGDADDSDSFFFTKPFNAANSSDNKDYENFAYWGYGHLLNEADSGIIFYSVPLISETGQVYGIMGVGVEEEYFTKNLYYQELVDGNDGVYFLCRSTDGEHFKPVVFNGSSYNRTTYQNTELRLLDKKENDVYRMAFSNEEANAELYGCVETISLYNNNTPFEKETWWLIGMTEKQKLFSDYNRACFILYLVSGLSVIIGFIVVIFTSRRITLPISRLASDLKKSDPNKPIKLRELNVKEIDDLTVAIEQLSYEVAESSSKIAKIITMTEAAIGVFEYRKIDDTVFCSRGMYDIFGWQPIVDSNEYVDSATFKERMNGLETYVSEYDPNIIEYPDGKDSVKWIKLNIVDEEKSVIGLVSDVTQSILEKKQIEYERDYDILTNVYNRRAFIEYMKRLFQKEPGEIRLGAFIAWDLDNLKFVNDSYGHSMGDQYIYALAECLKVFDDETVISGRRSGDEFYTFVFGFDTKEEILKIINAMWNRIQHKEIRLPDGRMYKIRVSAGIAWYPDDSTDYEELFRYADFAMYTVKHSRKGAIEGFDAKLYSENRILVQGQEEFNNLLDNHLIRYALQPIVNVKDGQIYGYELLMRSDVDMFRSPTDILRIAHAQSKLYDIEVMTWVEGMKTFAGFSESGAIPPGKKVFINSIASQKINADCEKLLESVYGKYLSQVICEFTEEDSGDENLIQSKIEMVRRWGAGIAIDDYGRGYNNQSILLGTSPDVLKIDIEIVRGIEKDEDRQALATSLIAYCKERNILVVAEGVESSAEMEALILLGVDCLQGFYVGKPNFEAGQPKKKVLKEIAAYYRSYLDKTGNR